MRSFALSTGSSGNTFFIESAQGARVLVDAGLTFSRTKELLEEREISITSLDAIFITHEHSDHIVGLSSLLKHLKCPIYLTQGTKEFVKEQSSQFHIVKNHDSLTLQDLNVFVLGKPHDAKEAVHFIFDDKEKKLGVFTDFGHVNDETRHIMKTLDLMYVEANYCEEHIRSLGSKISYHYISRTMSDVGHLSVQQLIEALQEVVSDHQTLVLSHISENTNSYVNAYTKVKEALLAKKKQPSLLVGFQGEPTPWIE